MTEYEANWIWLRQQRWLAWAQAIPERPQTWDALTDVWMQMEGDKWLKSNLGLDPEYSDAA